MNCMALQYSVAVLYGFSGQFFVLLSVPAHLEKKTKKNRLTGSLRAKCERASKHFNIEDLEKGSKFIEQLKRKTTEETEIKKGELQRHKLKNRLREVTLHRENILDSQSEAF